MKEFSKAPGSRQSPIKIMTRQSLSRGFMSSSFVWHKIEAVEINVMTRSNIFIAFMEAI
jgi:hypothetical protein